MRKLIIGWLLLLVGIACLAQQPSRAGLQTLLGVGTPPAVSASFQGAGDIVSGAAAWWGLRAYSAATRGNNIANVCNSTGGVDVGCADMVSDGTTGQLVAATISGITCPGANCTIKTLYDQSGALACTGNVACDIAQATVASRPKLTANCIGTTLPCMVFTFAGGEFLTNIVSVTLGQAMTYSLVSQRTGSTTSYNGTVGNGTFGVFYANSANNITLYAGSVDNPDVAATDSAWHAIQGVFNNASSVGYVDGSSTAVTSGASALTGSPIIGSLGGSNCDCKITEAGAWASGFTGTQAGNMNTNQHGSSGYNF